MADRFPLGHCGPHGDEEERAEPGPRTAEHPPFEGPDDPSPEHMAAVWRDLAP